MFGLNSTKSVWVLAVLGVAACQSTTGGQTDLLSRYEDLSALSTASFTSNTSVAAQTGTATFEGVGLFRNGDAFLSEYVGAVTIDADFDKQQLAGTVDEFARLIISNTSKTLGTNVNGALDITGLITATNTTVRSGVFGKATGSINGVNLSMSVDGNLTGSGATGMVLSFEDDVIPSANGTAYLER